MNLLHRIKTLLPLAALGLAASPSYLAMFPFMTLAGLALIACVFLVVTFNDVKNLFGL